MAEFCSVTGKGTQARGRVWLCRHLLSLLPPFFKPHVIRVVLSNPFPDSLEKIPLPSELWPLLFLLSIIFANVPLNSTLGFTLQVKAIMACEPTGAGQGESNGASSSDTYGRLYSRVPWSSVCLESISMAEAGLREDDMNPPVTVGSLGAPHSSLFPT